MPYKSYERKTRIDVENINEQNIVGCRENDLQEYHLGVTVPMGILPTDTTSDIVKIEYALIVCNFILCIFFLWIDLMRTHFFSIN